MISNVCLFQVKVHKTRTTYNTARKVNNTADIEVCRNFSTACAPLYPDGSFDFVYVDARHDYASAMEDIRAWWPKVRRGGILAGHDYVDALEAANSGFDWGVQVDGTRDNLARAVQAERRRLSIIHAHLFALNLSLD